MRASQNDRTSLRLSIGHRQVIRLLHGWPLEASRTAKQHLGTGRGGHSSVSCEPCRAVVRARQTHAHDGGRWPVDRLHWFLHAVAHAVPSFAH